MQCHGQTSASPHRQRGVALLLALLIALTLSLTLFFKTTTTATARLARERATDSALAQAKAALIAWSVVQGDLGQSGSTRRPGTLPCPDIDNSGTQTSSCSAAGGKTIGRLPWKTLGIDDLRDADGERLWYVLSDDFRRPGLNDKVINSDTLGSLQLYAADGTTLLTPTGEELAAIVFSSGPPLAGQDRVAGPNLAANYLDAANPWNNATAPGPFISGPLKGTQGDVVINDRIMALSSRELIAAIEKRALSEAQAALAAYLYDHGKYPNPAKAGGPYCATKKNGIGDIHLCNSDITVCFGRFPEDTTYAALWFIQNGWGRVMTYAVNKNSVADPSASECSTALNVDGASKSYVLVAPGAPKSGQARPSATLADYLEDGANNDAWTSSSNGSATFAKPLATSNDSLRSLP